MKNQLTPRLFIIGLVLTWAIWSIWPTIQYQGLNDSEIETLRNEGKLQELESKTIKQGLDLKGGMYIVLEVDLPTLIENLAINRDRKFNESINDIREQLTGVSLSDPEFPLIENPLVPMNLGTTLPNIGSETLPTGGLVPQTVTNQGGNLNLNQMTTQQKLDILFGRS